MLVLKNGAELHMIWQKTVAQNSGPGFDSRHLRKKIASALIS